MSERARGVDVSGWQPEPVGWEDAFASGVSFAYVKAGESGGREASFPAHATRARAAGLLVGGYWYVHPAAGTGKNQGSFFAAALAELEKSLGPLDLPPALDLETLSGAGVATAADEAAAFLDELELRTARRAVVYASPGFWLMLPAEARRRVASGRELWVADWTNAAAPIALPEWPAGWRFWQRTNAARVPGFLKPVDESVFAGTVDELRTWADACRNDEGPPTPRNEG